MSKKDQPLVSVVTPVYNGEPYLDECIQSVLSQQYQNWEFIIVNNCSTDRSLKIANKYAADDPRIRVLNNSEFLSHLKNSNHAFQQISSQSRYCKVLHADDWLFPRCLDQMVEIAEAHPSVCIVGSYCLWGDRVFCDGLPFPSHFVPGHEICRDTLLNMVNPFLSPTSLLIRSDVVRKRKPFYNEALLHADIEACYQILHNSDFGFVHEVLTFVRRHETSVTSTVAAPFNTYILTNLDLLTHYGPMYLNPEEYRSQLRFKFMNYYRFLAHSLFQLRERKFWKYHCGTLKQMGYPLDLVQLVAVAIREFFRKPATIPAFLVKLAARCTKGSA